MKRDRRDFLKGATLATAASATVSLTGCTSDEETPQIDTIASPPSHREKVNETGEEHFNETEYSPEEEEQYFIKNPVSDYMVDAIKSVGIDYIAINAGIMAGIQSLKFYPAYTKKVLSQSRMVMPRRKENQWRFCAMGLWVHSTLQWRSIMLIVIVRR